VTSHPQFWASGWQRAQNIPPGIAKYPRLAAERISVRAYKAKQRAKTMTTCQLCGRETDNSAFCSTCEPKASRVADVDSHASQLSKIVGTFPDLPADFTERDNQAPRLMAYVANDESGRIVLSISPRGARYNHPGFWVWELRPDVAESLLDQLRALLEDDQ
jgi:hypothetical protein